MAHHVRKTDGETSFFLSAAIQKKVDLHNVE